MASWKENKIVGFAAVIIGIICLTLIIVQIVKMQPPKAPSAEEQIRKAGGRI